MSSDNDHNNLSIFEYNDKNTIDKENKVPNLLACDDMTFINKLSGKDS